MDIEAAFNAIRSDMAAGHTSEVGPKVMTIIGAAAVSVISSSVLVRRYMEDDF